MAGSIIVFSGMDGAGKSTQIETLRSALVAAGRRPVTLWSRGGYTPGINLIKSLMRRGSAGKVVPESGPSQSRTQAFQRPLVRRTWLSLAMIDLMLLYGGWVRMQKWAGRDVICDRFLEDTALDFQINFPRESVGSWWLWRILKAVCPIPDHTFLLLISVEESQRRSKLKDEPFPDSADVLATRLAAYKAWDGQGHNSGASRIHVIDGTCSIEEVSRTVQSEVFGTNATDQPATPPASSPQSNIA